jgi:hypothetical protein
MICSHGLVVEWHEILLVSVQSLCVLPTTHPQRLQDLGHTLQSMQAQRRKLKAIVPSNGRSGDSSSSSNTPSARRR